MKQYLEMLEKIIAKGNDRKDRTGIGTRGLFGYQMRMDLSKGFPLLTTKKVFIRGIIVELLWFLTGDTNIRPLVQQNVHIWDDWPYAVYKDSKAFKGETQTEFVERIIADEKFARVWGDLGPVYGKQWRRWEMKDGKTVDQIGWVIDEIKKQPYSRRLLVSGWNVGEIQGLVKGTNSAPPLCHSLFQFYVQDGKLSCQLYQRSADETFPYI